MNYVFSFFFLLFIAIFIVLLLKNIAESVNNNHSPRMNVPATVASKRKVTSSHMNDSVMMSEESYYVKFRYQSGDCSEFRVNHNEYYKLEEGRSGTLYFQGTRYLGFE